MAMLSSSITLTTHSFLFLMGTLGNLFILIINFREWRKTGDISSRALITNTLGCSNIFLQIGIWANEFCLSVLPTFYFHDSVIKLFIAILTSLSFSSLLFSICLCFYYFVKIVQCNHSFFLILKRRITEITPWLLVGSLIVSFAIGIPSYWDLYTDPSVVTTFSGNVTYMLSFKYESGCQCIFALYTVLSSLAMTIFFFLTISIIISLCKHVRRVQKNSHGTCNANIGAHRTAAKTLASLLLLYIYFMVALSFLFELTDLGGTLIYSICLLMASSFPSFNSLILIMGNSKLRTSLKKLLFIKNSDDQNMTDIP